MATQYAFVDSNGVIQHITSPGSDYDYTSGQTYGTLVCRSVAATEDATTFIVEKIWDGSWYHRGQPPSNNHDWNPASKSWTFNSDRSMEAIRQKRNRLLALSDWTQVADAPINSQQLAEVRTYRTSLRNITEGLTLPLTEEPSITWPTPPACLG